jgi:DNA-binding protein Fis
MARLFITPRELDLISDLTKEVIKDVAGQKIFYYRARADMSNVNDLYQEATEKVFDPPLELECLVEWSEYEQTSTNFGVDAKNNVKVSVHYRDLLDKGVTVRAGDFFSYGPAFYEIVQAIKISKIFGQVEHTTGYRLEGRYAREGIISKRPIGPTGEHFTESDAVQKVFVQQRGVQQNEQGETNDKRQLVENGTLDAPLTGPRKVAEDGRSSSFYGDE